MHRIGRGGYEIEFLVEGSRLFVFRVDGEGADTGNVRRLERALHRILIIKLSRLIKLSDALAVPAAIYCQTREQHDWDWVTRQPLSDPASIPSLSIDAKTKLFGGFNRADIRGGILSRAASSILAY
jgi:hypothetical protein